MNTFFVAKNETVVDRLMDSDMLMKIAPDYYRPRFEAIAELRQQDDGSLHKGNGFRRVASFVNIPLSNAAGLLDPQWMKDKRRFYAWLDRGENKRYCTYDRRGKAGRQQQFERDFGHMFKEEPMDRFTTNTTPTPEGAGVRLFSEEQGRDHFQHAPAQMPSEPTGELDHSEDPNAKVGFGPDKAPEDIFKGCKSNPGLDRY